MHGEIVRETWQFLVDDTYVIADVDRIERKIHIRCPFWIRLFGGKLYWQWVHVKKIAIMELRRKYGYKIVDED